MEAGVAPEEEQAQPAPEEKPKGAPTYNYDVLERSHGDDDRILTVVISGLPAKNPDEAEKAAFKALLQDRGPEAHIGPLCAVLSNRLEFTTYRAKVRTEIEVED